jgi:nitrogen fixation protein FixH
MKLRFNWGVGIALVYTAFAMGTVSVVILASTQHVDLVSDDYYERSLTFDNAIEAAERGIASGATLDVDANGPFARLLIAFPEGRPFPSTGALTLYRASGSASDRVFPIAPDATGHQAIDLRGVPAGHWTAKMTWTAATKDYYLEREIVTP